MTGKLTCFAIAVAVSNRRLIFIQSLLCVVTVLFDISSDVTWSLDVPVLSSSVLIQTQPSNLGFTQVDNYTNYTHTL